MGAAPAESSLGPTLQDVQIAGRVLHFQKMLSSSSITIAVIYNIKDRSSLDEANALIDLFGGGLVIGDMVLHSVLVEQSHLTDNDKYDAVFATVGVDGNQLNVGLIQHQVSCLTRHLEQVAHGACTVAIRSFPTVGITLSVGNAALVGVQFATAFRMMVQEI